MIRVALATLGTWGDLQPFVHLAAALREAGHAVRILTQPEHAQRVRDECGAAVVPITRPLDPDEMAAIHREVIADPNPLSQVVTIVRHLVRIDGPLQYRASLDAVALCDVMVAHSTALHSQEAAIRRGIPCYGVVLAPSMLPTAAAPPAGLPDLGAANRLWWDAVAVVAQAAVGIRMRRSVRRAGGCRRELHPFDALGPDGTLVAASPALSPPQARRRVAWTGPWHRPPSTNARLPEELERFLAAGETPLYCGFGSMEPGGGDELGAIAAAAARRVGRRLVLQRGWAGMHAQGDDVCVVDHLPHDLLLPRVAAIAHHCGAGTSHAAARSGVPSVPVPFLADQPWFAGRLRALDAATPPIPRRRLSVEALAAGFARALDDQRLRDGARLLARRMRGEDGCARAVALIERLVADRASGHGKHPASSPAGA